MAGAARHFRRHHRRVRTCKTTHTRNLRADPTAICRPSGVQIAMFTAEVGEAFPQHVASVAKKYSKTRRITLRRGPPDKSGELLKRCSTITPKSSLRFISGHRPPTLAKDCQDWPTWAHTGPYFANRSQTVPAVVAHLAVLFVWLICVNIGSIGAGVCRLSATFGKHWRPGPNITPKMLPGVILAQFLSAKILSGGGSSGEYLFA